MKKVLFAIFTIITLGIFLIPSCFASGFNVSQLDNTNRLTNSYVTSDGYTRLIANMDNLSNNVNYYATLQCFSKTNLNTPIALFGTTNSVDNTKLRYYYGTAANDWGACTYYSSNNNFGYRSNTNFDRNRIIFFEIRDTTINVNDYVFNIMIVRSTTTGFIGSFVPNTYYNIEGYNNRGFFQYFTSTLDLSGVNIKTDITDSSIGFNVITLGDYKSQVYQNNDRNTNQYFLTINFNSMSIKDISNINISYLEIAGARVSGVYYSTFASLKSAKPYFNNNITLYNNNSTLFTSEGVKVGYEYDTIQSITFRLPDYTFKSSTYYNSNIGLAGYLDKCGLYVLNPSNQQSYNEGLKNGYDSGYANGKIDGYNEGVGSHETSFGNMMLSVADVPIRIISSMLNFEILGVNLMGFFMGLMTLILFVFIIRKFKE